MRSANVPSSYPEMYFATRRGGGRVVRGGDALCCCVALFPRVPSLSCWGDASVPAPTEGSAIPSWPQAAKRAWGRE